MDGSLAVLSPPTRRRAVRRAVRLLGEVTSRSWGGPVRLGIGDLSPFGLRLDTDVLLPAGEPVDLCFVPPSWPDQAPPLRVRGRVACVRRGRRQRDRARAGIGVAFVGLPEPYALLLARVLRGLPPPLPRRRVRIAPPALPRRSRERTLHVPLDLSALEDLRFEALGELLTAGRLLAPPAAGRGVVIPFPLVRRPVPGSQHARS